MKVQAIIGPTCTGKTEIACNLYDKKNIKIISLDSAMVYKELNIGSATPSQEFLQQYPHSLVNIINLSKDFTVVDYIKKAKEEITQAFDENKIPVLVGGTMMYLKALTNGINEYPVVSKNILEDIQEQISQKGLSHIYKQLQTVDTNLANKIKSNDTQRIIRAFSVYKVENKPMSSYNKTASTPVVVNINAIYPADRSALHQKIALRFKQMLKDGLLEEVQTIINSEVNLKISPLKAIGYKETIKYLKGENKTLQECEEKNIIATRQLAKRQLTWIRNWDGINLFSTGEELLQSILRKI
jgi:tRNA dimethylallyltransferase